ncbi:MAG TPA: sulfite dehydrogenase [Gemmatimonadales bacterium]|nr:sulfite dehydrogenase [Gemmatimonadales bacterium]
MTDVPISRRSLLAGAAGALGAGALQHQIARLQNQSGAPAIPPDPTKVPGTPLSALGERSPFERPRRVPMGTNQGASLTPLQDLYGIVTPADLHFERHHAGVPAIDPAQYKLLIHGMVERPMVFDLAALRRFPAVSALHFLECSGNGGASLRNIRPELTPQLIDGLTSTSEWTGVPLATLLREVGVKPGATWFLAEGEDAAVLARSIPIEKGWQDAIVAYGQNGEPLRPEQGYPARLFLPGWEGNTNVKWLRRIEVTDHPFMTREETSKYTDPLADGTARQFSFVMDAKSIITFPAYPVTLPGAGWWDITGIAWSGRGRITRVDISTDGGTHWTQAELQGPVLPQCHTRFRYLWNWDGRESLIMSRAVDETGYAQPTLAQLRAVRGIGTFYHFNHIRAWRVRRDGSVVFGLEG